MNNEIKHTRTLQKQQDGRQLNSHSINAERIGRHLLGAYEQACKTKE
ncbi:hypothetical protein [Parachlamydia sp.]